jgi:hypothetical protein
MKSVDGKTSAFLFAPTTQSAGIQSASRLVFHRYGSTCVLSQIWTAGNNYGRQVPGTRRERELEARHISPDETIVIAMR